MKSFGYTKAVLVTIGILLISALLFFLQKLVGLETLRETILKSGPLGPLVFIFFMFLSHVLAPIQGAPFYFLSFAIYGKWTLIYTHIAYLLSSVVNFWIARKFGRNIVIKLVGRASMQKIDHISVHEGVKALLIMRFFQGWINDFISYAAGLTAMKFSTYYIISFLAPLPWTILTFLFFDQVPQETAFFWALALGGTFFIIPPIYYFLHHKFSKGKISHTT
ncbi:hypothetical protein A3D85_00925 [Candidatus Amesbacteria bacterium RIFCSPHIGHO2_02_FULL_47_9]|uniref:TVP38/TMEM64 family membrane protein n=1 Tax=Candidatus Amesbacteria bacterium RIFCSPHIGHO2_01_FULL_48_32b TaxID=1797253 RepID=A0A1F4YCB4_9BACT|nr:MAG: hypothetical protein A2876_03585 [Candidatus Amesbacteria bacterium RIFCSPHIGHO2_01_FULL_48_32b]OGD04601.1 MAG: hypothetical protein A3D85_00925 [Candidatus Amesbacteria bacterium RIFCSPHIGHO2_02_FULL_47_9]OGD06768.1 MAG: hypothetical protein A2899_05285 [Candidatus Amesbacteria bacterium RIFCSPLOWO2_01_FULL_49_25]